MWSASYLIKLNFSYCRELDMRVVLRHFDKVYSKDEFFGEWPWTRTVAETLAVNKE